MHSVSKHILHTTVSGVFKLFLHKNADTTYIHFSKLHKKYTKNSTTKEPEKRVFWKKSPFYVNTNFG